MKKYRIIYKEEEWKYECQIYSWLVATYAADWWKTMDNWTFLTLWDAKKFIEKIRDVKNIVNVVKEYEF